MPSERNVLELLSRFPDTGDPRDTRCGTMAVTYLPESILQDSGYLIFGVRREVQQLRLTFCPRLEPRQNSVCEIQGVSNA